MKNIKIVSIYVSHHSEEYVKKFGLLHKEQLGDCVYVVNSSTSASKIDESLGFEIIEINNNIGFSAANDIGIRAALKYNPDYILIINPDVLLPSLWLTTVLKEVSVMQGSKLGVLSVPLLGYGFEKNKPNGLIDSLGIEHTWYGRWFERLIRQALSPQQVVEYLKRHKKLSLHHEAVCQLLYEEKAADGDLYNHLRIASKPYRKCYGYYDRCGKIVNRVDIDERPAVVERRSRIGDRDGDTIMGKGRKRALLTLVERKSLYTMMMCLTRKRSDLLAEAAVKGMQELKSKVKTITFDNGLEFADHKTIGEGLEANIYFAHPYASWEKGANENTSGLIRQYFPKGAEFKLVSVNQIKWVMDRLNSRSRKNRGCRSPNELFMGQRVDLLAA